MNRTDFTQLNDPNSELTQKALRRRCIIGGCKAEPGVFCTDTFSGDPLHERWERYVHIGRLLNKEDE